MKFSDELWQTKWAPKGAPMGGLKGYKYPVINPEFRDHGYGCDNWRLGALWLASLCEGAGDYFKEGVTIFDYGSGSGRLANFVSGHLKDFTYYGAEPQGAGKWTPSKRQPALPWGQRSIEKGRELLGHDDRVQFGYTDTPFEDEAVGSADIAILGSVFTHLLPNEVRRICDKLLPIIHRGGAVVFSVFLTNGQEQNIKVKSSGRAEGIYVKGQDGAYGTSGCYAMTWFPYKWFVQYAAQNDIQLSKTSTFLHNENCPWLTHHILRLEKKA